MSPADFQGAYTLRFPGFGIRLTSNMGPGLTLHARFGTIDISTQLGR
jgi:hypothetical protein